MDHMVKTILIISYAEDQHVPFVTRHLDKAKVPWALLETNCLGKSSSISISVSADADRVCLLASGLEIDLSNIGSIWNRRRVVNPMTASIDLSSSLMHQYIKEQHLALLDNAFSFSQVYWINRQLALRSARPKMLQLFRAKEVGLNIPRTLCSDSPKSVRKFVSTCNNTITKVVTPGTPLTADVSNQYMIYTQRFPTDVISDESISAAPAIYQEEIEKEYEARAIIINNKILTCRIDSQASSKTALDWRHYDFGNVAHSPIELPADISERLIKLTKGFGLVFSAVDLCFSKKGDWIFFELNANGQWAWLEEMAGLPIGMTLAAELTKGVYR